MLDAYLDSGPPAARSVESWAGLRAYEDGDAIEQLTLLRAEYCKQMEEYAAPLRAAQRGRRTGKKRIQKSDGVVMSLRVAVLFDRVLTSILERAPEDVLVLDLGSGFSTSVAALVCSDFGLTSCIEAYDTEGQWAQKSLEFLDWAGKSRQPGPVDLRTLLVDQSIRGMKRYSFDGPSADVIVHDVEGYDRRLELLPKLWDRLTPGGFLLLDDMHRLEYAQGVFAWLTGRDDVLRHDVYEATLDNWMRFAWLLQKKSIRA